MPDPDWNSIDVAAIKTAIRAYVEQEHDPDGTVVAHRRREDAHLVIAKPSPASTWGILTLSSTRARRPVVFAPQLLDLTQEHTITHGSVANAKGQPPRIHYLAIRAPGVTSARTRLAPGGWEALAPTQGWLLDVRAEQNFEAVPDYEYFDARLGWSNLRTPRRRIVRRVEGRTAAGSTLVGRPCPGRPTDLFGTPPDPCVPVTASPRRSRSRADPRTQREVLRPVSVHAGQAPNQSVGAAGSSARTPRLRALTATLPGRSPTRPDRGR